MARCWCFTTDNNHVSKAVVKVGSHAPPPCWGRTSRRGGPTRRGGCTIRFARLPGGAAAPRAGLWGAAGRGTVGLPTVLPHCASLPPSTTACASAQRWPLPPCLTSDQTNGFSCSEAKMYPKCCGRAETGTGRSGAGGKSGLGAPGELRSPTGNREPGGLGASPPFPQSSCCRDTRAVSGSKAPRGCAAPPGPGPSTAPRPAGRCLVRAGGSRVPPSDPIPSEFSLKPPGKHHHPAAAGLNLPRARPQSTHAVRGLYFCSSVFIY